MIALKAVLENSLKVLSVDHSSNTVGQYFNFDVASLDTYFGTTRWDHKSIKVRNQRTGHVDYVEIWRTEGGGSSGSAHGRWATDFREGQWETGDIVIFIQ